MRSSPTTSLCDGTPSLTSSSKDPTIASQVCLCLRLFDSAISNLGKDRTADSSSENLRDQLGRLRLWSIEVEAHNEVLQHRLCDAPRLRQGIIDLLRDLSAMIEKTIQINEGKITPWENLPDSDESDSDFDPDELTEQSDSEDNQTELAQLYTNIVEIITCLMRTSASIENPALDKRSIESRDKLSYSSEVTHKINEIHSRFPKAPQYLIVRLAVASCAREDQEDFSEDITPYVCTFEICDMADTIFTTINEWAEHEANTQHVESTDWQCRFGCPRSYGYLEFFREHLRYRHKDIWNSRRIEDLIKCCEKINFSAARNECVLCKTNMSVFEEPQFHLGAHMEALTSLATPSLSIASGVLSLSIFAFKSSVSLHKFIQGFKDNGKRIRELRREVEALRDALTSLQQLVFKDEAQFEALCLPLLRCGQNCKEFEEVIANSVKHSTDSKKSFRDWEKLQYLGGSIQEFKDLLAGYKATFSIAIGNINLRTAAVTVEAVKDFKVMLKETEVDLRHHLSDLGERLEELSTQDNNTKDKNIAERARIQAEIDSTRKCLVVCYQASEYAETARTNVFEDASAAQDAHMVLVSTVGELISAKRVTADIRATQILDQMSNTTL